MKISNDRFFFVIQSTLKYISFNWGIRLRSLLYKPFFKSFGKNIEIKDGVTFKYPSEISIGDHAKIGEFSYFVGKGGLEIGHNFLAGAGTKVITSSHNFSNLWRPISEQGLEFIPIKIGDDAWLGFDAKVFGGVVIGNGVVVGANTLVNKGDIPDFSIIVGSPYKIIGNRNEPNPSN